ncbi:hypothetical protein ACIGEL_09470 [Rossellomorea aquimaris]|uniref:hypothetical protein n=1 Tax=Rossellomorea aquimaris TaxID=189382 RepID=UPI0037C7982D
MTKRSRKSVLFIVTALFLILSACTNNQDENKTTNENEQDTEMTEEMDGVEHGDMNHSGPGEVPEGLKEASSLKYEPGSKAILKDAPFLRIISFSTNVIIFYYKKIKKFIENRQWYRI